MHPPLMAPRVAGHFATALVLVVLKMAKNRRHHFWTIYFLEYKVTSFDQKRARARVIAILLRDRILIIITACSLHKS